MCFILAGPMPALVEQIPKNSKKTWIGYILICVLLNPVSYVIWRPDAQVKAPHLTVKLRIDNAPLADRVELTNDFLAYTNFGAIEKVQGILFVPMQLSQTNLGFRFTLRNDTDEVAENVEFAIFVQKDAECVPDPQWDKLAPDRLFSDSEKIGHDFESTFQTNEMESYGIHIPNGLLPKEGYELPLIKLRPSLLPVQIPAMPETVIIIARAKKWPDSGIIFNLCFYPNSMFQANDFHKPFVLSVNTLMAFPHSPEFKGTQLTPDILRELQK